MSLFGGINWGTRSNRNRLALRHYLELRRKLWTPRGLMVNAAGTDSEAVELLLLDLLAAGNSPAEAAATLLAADVVRGSYADGKRELEAAFEHYRDQAERVVAQAQRTAEGLFRVNMVCGREDQGGALNRPSSRLGLDEATRVTNRLEAAEGATDLDRSSVDPRRSSSWPTPAALNGFSADA
jgi:hypothetical protein